MEYLLCMDLFAWTPYAHGCALNCKKHTTDDLVIAWPNDKGMTIHTVASREVGCQINRNMKLYKESRLSWTLQIALTKAHNVSLKHSWLGHYWVCKLPPPENYSHSFWTDIYFVSSSEKLQQEKELTITLKKYMYVLYLCIYRAKSFLYSVYT